MKKLLILISAVVAFLIHGAEKKLVYELDLDNPGVQKYVLQHPFAKIERDPDGTPVLTITVSPEAAKAAPDVVHNTRQKAPQVVRFTLDLEKMGVSGRRLYGEAEIRFSNVSKPDHRWNGVKFQLEYESAGVACYPSYFFGISGFGTQKEYFRSFCAHPIESDVKKARLALGLQESSGTVSFRNVRFYSGVHELPSVLEQKIIPQAKYTDRVLKQPVLRGVMSPISFREEDFSELRKWNVNLIRWQLTRDGGNDVTLEQYQKQLDRKINELQSVLDAARKYGFKVVIDLHPFGGARVILDSEKGRSFLLEFWKKVVARYKDHPALWGYDILNEPEYRALPPEIPSRPSIASEVIREIRAIDPETPIIVESDGCAQYDMLEFLPVFDAVNIIYSIHFYMPGEYTHQLEAHRKPFLHYPDDSKKWNKAYIRRLLTRAREFQQKTGARIYVGEVGCIRWAPGGNLWLRDCIDLFEEYGWDWSYHAYREWDGWSAEHSENPEEKQIQPMTPRKQLLLDYFSRNRR